MATPGPTRLISKALETGDQQGSSPRRAVFLDRLPLREFLRTSCGRACAGTNRQQTVGENEKKTSTTQTSPTLGGIHPREVEPCVSWSDPRGEA